MDGFHATTVGFHGRRAQGPTRAVSDNEDYCLAPNTSYSAKNPAKMVCICNLGLTNKTLPGDKVLTRGGPFPTTSAYDRGKGGQFMAPKNRGGDSSLRHNRHGGLGVHSYEEDALDRIQS